MAACPTAAGVTAGVTRVTAAGVHEICSIFKDLHVITQPLAASVITVLIFLIAVIITTAAAAAAATICVLHTAALPVATLTTLPAATAGCAVPIRRLLT
jgi:hypothetical protein